MSNPKALTAAGIAEAKAAHYCIDESDPSALDYECHDCGGQWPCLTYQLLGHIAGQDARIEKLMRDRRVQHGINKEQEAALERKDAEIAALDAEIARLKEYEFMYKGLEK